MLILIRMHGTTDQVGTDLFRTSVGYTLREKAQRLRIQPTCSAPQYGLSGQGELAIFEFGIFESLCQLSVGFHVESEHGEHGAERPCLGIFWRLLHDSGARSLHFEWMKVIRYDHKVGFVTNCKVQMQLRCSYGYAGMDWGSLG